MRGREREIACGEKIKEINCHKSIKLVSYENVEFGVFTVMFSPLFGGRKTKIFTFTYTNSPLM